jgi:large subunit ribosomal protein L31
MLVFMKKDIHPKDFRPVIFFDNGNHTMFLVHSTVKTTEKGTYLDGKEYPLFRVEISSASHPFYTGKETLLDTAGRVEKFKSRSTKAAAKPAKKVAAEAAVAK